MERVSWSSTIYVVRGSGYYYGDNLLQNFDGVSRKCPSVCVAPFFFCFSFAFLMQSRLNVAVNAFSFVRNLWISLLVPSFFFLQLKIVADYFSSLAIKNEMKLEFFVVLFSLVLIVIIFCFNYFSRFVFNCSLYSFVHNERYCTSDLNRSKVVLEERLKCNRSVSLRSRWALKKVFADFAEYSDCCRRKADVVIFFLFFRSEKMKSSALQICSGRSRVFTVE